MIMCACPVSVHICVFAFKEAVEERETDKPVILLLPPPSPHPCQEPITCENLP